MLYVIELYHNHDSRKGNVDCGEDCTFRDGEFTGHYVDDSECASSKMSVYNNVKSAQSDAYHINKTWFSAIAKVEQLHLIDSDGLDEIESDNIELAMLGQRMQRLTLKGAYS